ncbi:hypothetical protein FJT64_024691 [Amphibalanus amphitrite]|uniref:Uncharacterized protein n=1 Tax=Amphibalanus amphitrite TaxID=1232801 RepID=A0A6A4WDN2_AMPAM|nr:hypothetical protein FJT64_024691 [Amphibalanus amphitrite]
MADLSADADTSTNLDSSYTGSPLAKLSSRVGQLRVWQEQQRARLIRQQEETQRVFEEKQSELAALIGSPGSGGGSPARQAGEGSQRPANSPATNSSSTALADRHNSRSATETNTMSPQRQSEGPGAPAEHEDTPLRPVQFDTLLERELQRQTPPAPAALTAAGPPAAKRPFLKRGTGLQRFGLRPGQQVRLRPGRGRAGRAAGRGGRIVLRSAPRGDGPWRPAPGRDPVADPADTLALLGDLRVAAGPAASAARPAPGLSHRPATPGAPPAGRLNLPSVGRPRSHLPAGAITVEKVARPPGGATGAPDQQPDSTPRGKVSLGDPGRSVLVTRHTVQKLTR